MVNLFGIPTPLIGFACFLIAAVFYFVWPKAQKGEDRGMWMNIGLHLLHPLAWVLLGMAAFMAAKGPATAGLVAALGGAAYIFFIVLFMQNSRK